MFQEPGGGLRKSCEIRASFGLGFEGGVDLDTWSWGKKHHCWGIVRGLEAGRWVQCMERDVVGLSNGT